MANKIFLKTSSAQPAPIYQGFSFLQAVHCSGKRRVKIRVLMQEGKEKAWLGVRRSAESSPDNM